MREHMRLMLLGLNHTKQGIKILAQGHNTVPLGSLKSGSS